MSKISKPRHTEPFCSEDFRKKMKDYERLFEWIDYEGGIVRFISVYSANNPRIPPDIRKIFHEFLNGMETAIDDLKPVLVNQILLYIFDYRVN